VILAIKTSDMRAYLALFEPSQTEPVGQLEWESGRKLSDELLARIIELTGGNRGDLAKLTGIIIFSGPGSFTSLRIGHAVANALASGLEIPVVGAAGDDWHKQGLAQVRQVKPGVSAIPQYGAEAHITRPKT